MGNKFKELFEELERTAQSLEHSVGEVGVKMSKSVANKGIIEKAKVNEALKKNSLRRYENLLNIRKLSRAKKFMEVLNEQNLAHEIANYVMLKFSKVTPNELAMKFGVGLPEASYISKLAASAFGSNEEKGFEWFKNMISKIVKGDKKSLSPPANPTEQWSEIGVEGGKTSGSPNFNKMEKGRGQYNVDQLIRKIRRIERERGLSPDDLTGMDRDDLEDYLINLEKMESEK